MNDIDRINKRIDSIEGVSRTHEMRLNAQKTEISQIKDKVIANEPRFDFSYISGTNKAFIEPLLKAAEQDRAYAEPTRVLQITRAEFDRLTALADAAIAYAPIARDKPYTTHEAHMAWCKFSEVVKEHSTTKSPTRPSFKENVQVEKRAFDQLLRIKKAALAYKNYMGNISGDMLPDDHFAMWRELHRALIENNTPV